MLSGIMLNVVITNVIMVSVIVLNVAMLNVIILNDIMLNVTSLNVVVPVASVVQYYHHRMIVMAPRMPFLSRQMRDRKK